MRSLLRHPAFSSPLTLTCRFLTTTPFSTPRLTTRSFAPRAKRRRRTKQWVATDGSLPPVKIAVIGSGLAGLATTYHLLHSTRRMAKKRNLDSNDIQVTVYDPCKVGEGGATAAAAGLLHPFTPRVKKKVWQAKKAIPAVSTLVEVAQQYSDVQLMRVCGLLRLATDERSVEDYTIASNRYPFEVKFWDPATVKLRCPVANSNDVPGVFLPHAAVIDVPKYTTALAAACKATGRVTWCEEMVHDIIPLLNQHDAVVITNGAGIRAMKGLTHIPITPCRGQNVMFAPTNEQSIQPPFPIIHGKYVIPDVFGEGRGLMGGATFEYHRKNESELSVDEFIHSHVVDVGNAVEELNSHIKSLVPSLDYYWKPDYAVSGMRALPPRSKLGTVPIAGRLQGIPDGKSAWIFTGLGSRGVLYHAYLGRCVAHAVVAGNEKLIPIDARRNVAKLERD